MRPSQSQTQPSNGPGSGRHAGSLDTAGPDPELAQLLDGCMLHVGPPIHGMWALGRPERRHQTKAPGGHILGVEMGGQ